jgi:general secretion pathway protein A
MYKAFFNLTRNPFDLTPDPTCFVPTKRHNEALAALYYGVRRHKGFVVVTGEVGTGKTLLLRCLLRLLEESKDIAYAYLFNGRLTPTEFLQYILTDFGVPAAGKSKCELLIELGQFGRKKDDHSTDRG